MENEKKAMPDPVQVSEGLRFSLGTLLGIADKIKEVEPMRQAKPTAAVPDNILAPEYRRPWWSVLAGVGGLYLGYRLLHKKAKPGAG